MNKYLSNILMLAVLLLAGTALTSCSHSDDPAPEPEPSGPKTYTLTIKASKSPDTALTRALTLDGTTLKATWAEGEAVTVYNKSKNAPIDGTLIVQSDKETIKGTLTGTIEADDVLTLKFLSPDYNSQDGTLTGTAKSIDKTCDYAEATVNVQSVDASNNVTFKESSATFTNQQIIVKFTLKNTDGSALLNPTALTVDYLTGSVSLTGIPTTTYSGQTYSNGDGVLYVAMPNIKGKDMKLTATVGTKTYTYWKSNVPFQDNKYYYTVNVKMFDPFSTPLTIEAVVDDNENDVSFINYSGTLYYSFDNSSWQEYTYTIDLKEKGQKVYFKGDDITNSSTDVTQIICRGNCYVYGNIMSLIDKDNFAQTTVLSYSNTFSRLFYDEGNSVHIYSHPSKELVLPATTLTPACYNEMFRGCSNLVRAPELPASELTYSLQNNAYSGMFINCSSLKFIKCLATDISATDCTYNWVSGVAENGTFVVNSSLTINEPANPTTSTVNNGESLLWDRGDSGIPVGWTVTK